jgi:hypothetical protein
MADLGLPLDSIIMMWHTRCATQVCQEAIDCPLFLFMCCSFD